MNSNLQSQLRLRPLASRRRLLSAGVGAGVLDHALMRGELVRVARGIYADPDLDLATLPARWALGLAVSEPDGVLSHATAAAVRGLRRARPEETVHVTVPHGRGRPRAIGVRVHQTDRPDYAVHEGWPVSGVREMAVQLAGAGLNELRYPGLAAIQKGWLTPGSLADVSGVPKRVRGVWRMVAEEAAAGAESGAEAEYWRAVGRAGLPRPRLNVTLAVVGRRYRADALWEQWGLIAEIDGREYHDGPDRFERDRVRQNDLHGAGFVVVRFPAGQVQSDPEGVAEVTRRALLARGWRG